MELPSRMLNDCIILHKERMSIGEKNKVKHTLIFFFLINVKHNFTK